VYDEFVKATLDKHAPYRKMKIHSNYKFGLSQLTLAKMRERDQARKAATLASANERVLLQSKYKALRNLCNRLIRRDSKEATSKRVSESINPSTVWRRVRHEITDPKSSNPIKLKIGENEIEDEETVANAFNDFFVAKVERLRHDIDRNLKENPTRRLEEKMRDKRLHFQLRPVSQKSVSKALKNLKSKKSSGLDDISQCLLKSMSSVIALPL